MIDDDQRRHGFYDGHGAGEHAGIMTPPARELGGLAMDIDRLLRAQEGGRWFERDAAADLLAVADAALHTSAAVGPRTHLTFTILEEVVVLRPLEQGAGKTAA